ncbi:hypothetical protein D3C80_1522780 [compost metagenome]
MVTKISFVVILPVILLSSRTWVCLTECQDGLLQNYYIVMGKRSGFKLEIMPLYKAQQKPNGVTLLYLLQIGMAMV